MHLVNVFYNTVTDLETRVNCIRVRDSIGL